MTRRPPTRRPAAALLEVLIGFGILGIAVTSIITLFPFSAITIGNALKDDRSTTCAVCADAFLHDYHQHYVVEPGTAGTTITEPYFTSMDSGPAGATAVSATAGDMTNAASALVPTPGYPVYLDPMGVQAGQPATVGDTAGLTSIPRVTLQPTTASFALQNPTPLRLASQLDGLTYTSDGFVQGAYNMREYRYNVAWMLQRPSNRDRYTVRQQVVVYNRRAPLYAPAGTEAVSSNAANVLTPGATTFPIYVGTQPTAEIRRGTWILDASTPAAGVYHAEFYRVVSVTDNSASNGTYALEVHKPVVRLDGLTGAANAYTGTLVVMPGVCDVFQRPALTANLGAANGP
jgi:hypothetical protein